MIAVVFEVIPYSDKRDSYLEIAAGLAEDLKSVDGFISVERFKSLTNPNKLLSLSYWRDEEAVRAWRTMVCHRQAQKRGRRELFEEYRICVTQIIRDYGKFDREQVPNDSLLAHDSK